MNSFQRKAKLVIFWLPGLFFNFLASVAQYWPWLEDKGETFIIKNCQRFCNVNDPWHNDPLF